MTVQPKAPDVVFVVDPQRAGVLHNSTPFYIRAKHPTDGWGSYNIAELDEASLRAWLTGRGEAYAIDVVVGLCGHG